MSFFRHSEGSAVADGLPYNINQQSPFKIRARYTFTDVTFNNNYFCRNEVRLQMLLIIRRNLSFSWISAQIFIDPAPLIY